MQMNYCGLLYEIDSNDSIFIVGTESKEKSIVIPKTISERKVVGIREHSFSDSLWLEDVLIEADLEYIGAFAFEFCENLKNINLPDSVSYIGESAFEGCCSLEQINIPFGLTRLEKSTFE